MTQQNLWIKWKIKCEKDRKECRTLQNQMKNIQLFGDCAWLPQWMHRHSWGRISWIIKIPSRIPQISPWRICFDITEKLVSEQEEIVGVDKINWEKHIWKQLSLIGDETVINLQRAKVYVFSDSVLCLGRIHQHPESNDAWDWMDHHWPKLQRLWRNQWRPNRVRVEHLPRTHNVAALR